MSTTLTESQENILAFMVRHQADYGRPPSLREIRDQFQFASVKPAMKHVQALARKGFVGQTDDGRTWAPKVSESQGYLFTVPVYGTIPAGLPVDTPAASTGDHVRFDPTHFGLKHTRDLLALKVRGDSMVDAQIADGDVAILRRKPAKAGDIVAALIDGETTLKRLVQDRRGTYLQAENKRYRDLVPTESLTIQGVLVGLIGCGKR